MDRKTFLRGTTGAAALAALCAASPGLAFADSADNVDNDTAATVQLLADRASITECQYRYARGADLQDADLLASAFDETISVYYPLTGTQQNDVSGIDMARGITDNFIENGIITQHYMNVYQIDIDGDAASAITYLRATHVKDDMDPYIVGGYYENTYVRTADGWKIKTVTLWNTYEEGPAYFG